VALTGDGGNKSKFANPFACGKPGNNSPLKTHVAALVISRSAAKCAAAHTGWGLTLQVFQGANKFASDRPAERTGALGAVIACSGASRFPRAAGARSPAHCIQRATSNSRLRPARRDLESCLQRLQQVSRTTGLKPNAQRLQRF